MGGFIVPRKTFWGLGSISNLKDLHGKKAVIVTGAGSMRKTGQIDRVQAILGNAGIASSVFEGVEARAPA